MANTFDLDQFLSDRAELEAGATPAFDRLDYAGAGTVQMAGSQKRYDLEAIAQAKQKNLEDSLVGKLGLELGESELINSAASLVSGAGRMVGETINLLPNFGATSLQSDVSEEAIQAFNRMQTGEAQEGDDALLNAYIPTADGTPRTALESLQSAQALRDAAGKVSDFFDWSGIVDSTNRDRLSADIAENTEGGVTTLREAGQAFDRGEIIQGLLTGAQGVGETIAGAVPAAAQNPAAVLEYASENLPQLAAAAKSAALGVATNVGYAADQLRSGYQDYAEENQGQLPNQDERIKMGVVAASLALAEQVGDLGVLRAARGESGGIVRAVVGASAKEGVTEGYQTWGEAQVHMRDASIEEIVEGATIGAAVGGTFAGGGSVATAAGKAAATANQKAVRQEAVAVAQETGNIEELVNPQSSNYNPAAAVNVVHAQAKNENLTPEQRTDLTRKADTIEQNLTQQISSLEKAEMLFSEEGQQVIADEISRAEAELQQPNADEAALTSRIESLRGIQEQAASRTPEVQKAEAAQLKELRSQLTRTREAVKQLQIDMTPSADEVAEIVTEAQAPQAEVAQPAAERILTLTMANPDAVDIEQLQQLAVSGEQLTDTQRSALRAFSESQSALNELKGMEAVRTDIERGGDGFKGLDQYRNTVRVALQNGETEAAQGQVEMLASFAASRVSKFDAISAAYEQVKGTNNIVRVARNSQGVWTEVPAEMTARQFKKLGGVEVSARSFKLRDSIGLEATALSRAAESLAAVVQSAPVRDNTAVAEQVVAEEVTAAPEAPVEAEVTQEVGEQVSQEETAVETGELTAIRNSSEIRGQAVAPEQYQTTNLVGAFFEQRADKDETSTKRPLVAVKDFATAVRTGKARLSDFVSGDLTGQQQSAVRRFFGFQRVAAPIIARNLQRRTGQNVELYNFRDQAQFLINEDGSLDENLVTAISYAAFAWANDSASDLRNTDAGINAILGKQADEEISPEAYARLSTIGTRQAVAVSQMGAKVVEILGLEALDNAPANEKSRLEASLGAQVMALLSDRSVGLLRREVISDAELQRLMGNREGGDPRVKHFFVAPTSQMVDGRLRPSALAQSFREATVGSQSVLDKLFGSQQGNTEPSMEPVPFTQQRAKRTQQGVPSKLANILNKQGEKAHFLRQDMWQVWGNLSPDSLYKIAGVVDITDNPTHKHNRASREAKNDGLRREVDQFAEFFSKINTVSPEGTEQALYFGRSVWKPQRVGLTSNVINPQTSKVHRHMLRMEEWKAELRFDDEAAMDGFKLRILEAFGVKTEAKNTVDVLAGYESKINTPEIQGAVDALVETLRGEAENIVLNEQAILAGVAAGGENFHSLDALVALAQEKIARQDGAESFTTEMMGEVDGVTNGPMLSLLMLGAKGFETLNQGGFFSLEDGFTQFNEFHAEAGNLDLYESNIADVLKRIQASPELAALEVITGKLTDKEGNVSSKGRKIIKQPLTAMMFGSNTGNAVEGMAEGFIETIYERMEEASSDPARMKEVLTAVNALIAKSNKNKRALWPVDISGEVALNTEFTAQQERALLDSFYDLIGSKVEESLEENYAEFLARRDVVNQSAGLAFDMYQAAYDTLREMELENAQLPRNRAGVSMVDLTVAQERALRDRLKPLEPLLHTALSKASNELEAGMLMAKTKRELDDSYQYTTEAHFGQPVDYIDADGNVANAMSMTVSSLRSSQDSPGVAPFITAIHSSDSNIASTSYDAIPALNIHDALGTSLDRIHEVGQTLNKNTFETMLNYSTASEMVSTLERTISGFAELIQDQAVAERIQPKLKKILAEREVTALEQLESMRHVAIQSDTSKLRMLSDMRAVGQYATDGGSYLVTDADRQRANEALEQVGKSFSEVAQEHADLIDALAQATPVEAKPKANTELSNESVQRAAPATSLNTIERVKRNSEGQLRQDAEEVSRIMAEQNVTLEAAKAVLPAARAAELVQAVAANTPVQRSAWGQIGKPVIESDAALVELLQTSEGLTARGLAQALEARSQSPFNKKLLQAVGRLVTESTPVVLVTAETGPDGAMGNGVSNARGWYASSNGFDALYVKSPDFVESGITEEMLTHELLHTVTGRVIDRHQGKNTDAGKLIEELDALRKQANELLNANTSLKSKYSNAVSSVHELVSWGMTNQGFQEEVLKNIQVAATGRNPLLTGLQKFINTLARLVGLNSAADRNGLGLLIANTSGLFAEAKRSMDQRQVMTLKYEDALSDVDRMTTQEIFMELSSNRNSSVAHTEHLSSLLDTIVEKLHGPMGAFRNEVARGQALTNDEVFIKALDTGVLPFASKALASDFIVSQQEAFVLEQVEVTVAESLKTPETFFVRDSLQKLWNEAKTKLSAKSFFQGDWNAATQAEKDVAQAKYDMLFKLDSIASRNDYLSRFAALGLASEEVRNALNFASETSQGSTSGMPIGARIIELFRRLMTRLSQLHDKTKPGQAANSRLFTLVDRLVDIEAKRRGRIAEKKAGMLDQVETALSGVSESVRETLSKIGESKVLQNSRSPFIRFAGKAISATAAERVDLILSGVTRIRDQAFRSQHGLAMGVLTEMRGVNSTNQLAHALFKQAKMNEVERKQHIDYTVVQVNEAFKDNGKYLTQNDKAALTRTLLRTNMGVIEKLHGFAKVQEIIENPAAAKALRDDLTTQLKAFSNSAYYIGAVKDLAYNRVIGGNVSPNLMLNTTNIARMYGTSKALAVASTDERQIVPLLDQLLALYSYEYAPSQDKDLVKEVVRTESMRGSENGVQMIMKLHQGLLERSKEILFQGTEALMISGYTPDIFDNKIESIAASQSDVADLQKRGYVVVGKLQEDKAAGLADKKVLMTRRGSGQVGLLSGAFSYTGLQAKGSSVDHDTINMLNGNAGASNKKAISTIRKNISNDVAAMFNRDDNYDPRKQKANRVVPTMNPNGGIANYRYMMTEANRDSLLDRDNSMDQVLGVLAGQLVDKVSSSSQNIEVVRAMHDQYREDFNNRPESYLQVGKDSTDPELAELYKLLPQDTKREIRKVWKTDNMMIPADQLNLIMGYRKYSLTTPFGLDAEERNVAEKILVSVAEALPFLGEKAALRIGRAEDVAQELVREAKDIIVVKNIFTLVGNIVSNITLLAIEGVPVLDSARNVAVGIKGAMQYRADNKRLIQLMRAVDVGYLPGGDQAVQDEIAVLRDRLARNPVKPLIDAGLMPTIVEDVEVGENPYSYKSQLQKKVENYSNKVPKFIRDVGRFVYMAHDTSLYKFLSQTTQLSDFVSRYALYEHLTNRKKNPLSKADALLQTEEAFINYDLPSHRSLQFMNDMGLVMFTKYYLRIQKVIARLVREKPGRVLAMVLMSHFISGLQSVMDSSWLNRLGNNPFEIGPWSYPAALDELPAIKGLMNM